MRARPMRNHVYAGAVEPREVPLVAEASDPADPVRVSRRELERLRRIADLARRLRAAQTMVLGGHTTAELLEAVRTEARVLRLLDEVLDDPDRS